MHQQSEYSNMTDKLDSAVSDDPRVDSIEKPDDKHVDANTQVIPAEAPTTKRQSLSDIFTIVGTNSIDCKALDLDSQAATPWRMRLITPTE